MGKGKSVLSSEATFRKTARERERRGFLSATPERMAKTDEAFQDIHTVDEAGNSVETQTVTVSPLERLYKAGAFGNDEDLANQRHEAGERYYGYWFYGRSFPLGSRDYRQPYSGASGDPYSVAPSQERVEHSRGQFRKAEAALGSDRIASVTRAIVIDEKEPADVGLVVSGRRDKAQARAVAIEFLIDGLDRLRALWAMRT